MDTFFEKEAKWKNENIFNWISTCRRIKIDTYLSPSIKLKFKWIKDLNLKPDTLNLIEENVGNILEHSGTGAIS